MSLKEAEIEMKPTSYRLPLVINWFENMKNYISLTGFATVFISIAGIKLRTPSYAAKCFHSQVNKYFKWLSIISRSLVVRISSELFMKLFVFDVIHSRRSRGTDILLKAVFVFVETVSKSDYCAHESLCNPRMHA